MDELLAVTRECLNPAAPCSGLDRCLRHYGVTSLKALLPPAEKTKVKLFKAYEPGFVRLDVKSWFAIESDTCLGLSPSSTTAPP
ncbi:hypothetical protein [Methylocaldum szegediense]|uniref:Transposase n=1 Tax=Methylocaldum szegediense TaxID=73780 RepID=A0ABM9HXE9_9GAMM|nr:hypothetical protein [Methylocaldum szegediense]CAI8751255.1 protein of unknown function [Methylocaldum szegediense]